MRGIDAIEERPHRPFDGRELSRHILAEPASELRGIRQDFVGVQGQHPVGPSFRIEDGVLTLKVSFSMGVDPGRAKSPGHRRIFLSGSMAPEAVEALIDADRGACPTSAGPVVGHDDLIDDGIVGGDAGLQVGGIRGQDVGIDHHRVDLTEGDGSIKTSRAARTRRLGLRDRASHLRWRPTASASTPIFDVFRTGLLDHASAAHQFLMNSGDAEANPIHQRNDLTHDTTRSIETLPSELILSRSSATKTSV